MQICRVLRSTTVIPSPELDTGCFTVDLSSIHWEIMLPMDRTNFSFDVDYK